MQACPKPGSLASEPGPLVAVSPRGGSHNGRSAAKSPCVEGSAAGRELKIGDDFRIAPGGNRGGYELPHYHRRILDADGDTIPRGGIKWHPPLAKGLVMTLHPVFVLDNRGNDGAVMFSVHELKEHIEPVDLERGEYDLFDASARRLDVIEGHLVPKEEAPVPDELQRRLRRLLVMIGEDSLVDKLWDEFVASAAQAVSQWQARRKG